MKSIKFPKTDLIYALIVLFLLFSNQNTYSLVIGLFFISIIFYILYKHISLKHLSFYLITYNLIPWDPLFSSNQSIYFPHILKNLNYGGLENDWYSSYPAPYPVFDYVTEYLIKITNLSFLEILPWIFLCIGLMAIEKISLQLMVPENKVYIIYFATVFLIIWNKLPPIGDDRIPEFLAPAQKLIGITQIFLGGLHSFTIFSFVYQPQAFDLLFLLGIYYFTKQKYFISFSLSALTGVFHYWLFLPIFVMYLIYVLKERKNRTTSFFAIFFLVPLVTFVVLLNIMDKVDINQTNENNSQELATVETILDKRIGIHRISNPHLTLEPGFIATIPFLLNLITKILK